MTLLPDGRSERAVFDAEIAAAREFQRLTRAYLSKVRELYPAMGRPTRQHVTPTLQQLRELVDGGGLTRKLP